MNTDLWCLVEMNPPRENEFLERCDVDMQAIQWLQILGDNIFLTLEWQFPVTFYIGFSVGLTPYN